jgi:uncharacterized hydrophobic protein (TIGR00271 family)
MITPRPHTEPEKKTTGPAERPRTVRSLLGELLDAIRDWFADFINLNTGMDRESTVLYIRNSKSIRGANAWLLVASIFVASIGLDLNSDAVIIGGMLISPLMAPILGVGLSIGTNDKESLFSSLQHFGVAMLIAIITSTIYFLLTPLGEYNDSIDARTAPTLLDCLVAIFGGLAGIISITRKEKGSAIPGVAIATALMPPLCVTGYGIANGDSTVTINSFYLFFLNSFFIALTTFIIVRLLNFPLKQFMDPHEQQRTTWILVVFTVLIMLPSAKILYDVWSENRTARKVEWFIQEHFNRETGTFCIKHNIVEEDTVKLLELQLIGNHIPEDSTAFLYEGLRRQGLKNFQISLIQDREASLEELKKLRTELQSLEDVAGLLRRTQEARSEVDLRIEELQGRIDSLQADTIPFYRITREAEVLFPNIERLGYGQAIQRGKGQTTAVVPTFMVQWDGRLNRYQLRQEEEKLTEFLKLRAELDTVQLLKY